MTVIGGRSIPVMWEYAAQAESMPQSADPN